MATMSNADETLGSGSGEGAVEAAVPAASGAVSHQ